jgi:chloramphenicol-sensitive protein RarD
VHERRRGLIFGVSAYALWGLFPLYWPLLEPASALEILAQRVIWSLIILTVVLRVRGGYAGVAAVLRNRRQRGLLMCAAVVVSVNWGTYIWGVNSHHVVETSLGYFINPLLTVVLGVLVLHERLRLTQWVAVGIGTVAVAVITIDYGRPPWIAFVLAVSFGLYGLFKKQAAVGALDSLAIETGTMFLPAVVTLVVIGAQGNLVFGTHSAGTTLLLVGSGFVTTAPLLLFAAATRRLPLSIVGLLQFLAPVLQFAVGVGVKHEPLPTAELIGFILVWLALIVLAVDGVRHQRRAQPAALEPAPV